MSRPSTGASTSAPPTLVAVTPPPAAKVLADEKEGPQRPSTIVSETATLDDPEPPKDPHVEKELLFFPIPKHLRHDPEHPPHFGLFMNVLFGMASTFLVANLYYCQPLLIQLSHTFDVSYNEVSRIPTLVQAGYATGLLLLTPLGDLVRRRPLVLLLTFLSAALTIGLPITSSITVFEILSFLIGATSVVPQILMPFAFDLAPPNRRASALAIVLSGLLLGVLMARVMAGIVANFVIWRVVYWIALGLQTFILAVLYWFLPDWPAKNPDLTYFTILWTMAKFAVTEPLLIQSEFINMASMACFTNFWVTLTFLLGGPLYNYNTLDIGLFGFVGMAGVAVAPFAGRVTDKFVPWFVTLVATLGSLVFYSIQCGAGGLNVAAVVIACFGIDALRQTQQVSITTGVLTLDAKARSRLNAVLIISIFIGQIVGTSVGTAVFNSHGWRAAAALSVGWQGFCLLMLSLRGPHAPRKSWFGYAGGLAVRKKPSPTNSPVDSPPQAETHEKEKPPQHQRSESGLDLKPTMSAVPELPSDADRKEPIETHERTSTYKDPADFV